MPRITVTLSECDLEKLRDAAKREGLSASSYVRSIIMEDLGWARTVPKIQSRASEQGTDWVALMRRLLQERLDEVEEDRKGESLPR